LYNYVTYRDSSVSPPKIWAEWDDGDGIHHRFDYSSGRNSTLTQDGWREEDLDDAFLLDLPASHDPEDPAVGGPLRPISPTHDPALQDPLDRYNRTTNTIDLSSADRSEPIWESPLPQGDFVFDDGNSYPSSDFPPDIIEPRPPPPSLEFDEASGGGASTILQFRHRPKIRACSTRTSSQETIAPSSLDPLNPPLHNEPKPHFEPFEDTFAHEPPFEPGLMQSGGGVAQPPADVTGQHVTDPGLAEPGFADPSLMEPPTPEQDCDDMF
jgi:hypothetical protein